MRIDPNVPLRRTKSGAIVFRPLSRIAALSLVTLALACDDPVPPTSPPPRPTVGVLSGTVTLLGDDGPPLPFGNLTLYASENDLDLRIPRYTALLHRQSETLRVYDFAIGSIVPGDYYVLACWAIACGEYRDPGTGVLRTVRIRRGVNTRLNFGL